MSLLPILPLFKSMLNVDTKYQLILMNQETRHTTLRMSMTIVSGISLSAAILAVVSASTLDLVVVENHMLSMILMIT